MRTDSHNNPTAFTTAVALTGGLIAGTDFTQGDPFTVGSHTYYTARLIGDPIALTIKLIDKVSFQTSWGAPRWSYIDLPKIVWDSLSYDFKKAIIGLMYKHEGGTAMRGLFT
jgi:hypothetical protein